MTNSNPKQHLLVVDDDREICRLLQEFLGQHGYEVTLAGDARQAYTCLQQQDYDLLVLDLMLPGEDGLSICRQVRASSALPIIMLTALGEETDRIVGLEIGADDYLPKPFNPRELLARIKAVLRRFQDSDTTLQKRYANPLQARRDVLDFAGWRLDLGKRELRSPQGNLTSLTSGEYNLLLAFVENPQKVLNRDQLLEYTKGRHASPFDRSIDVQLSRLRRKIEPDPKNPTMIKTVRSGGYVLSCAVESCS